MKLWFQVIETKVSNLWNQSFNRLKLLETTSNDFFTLAHPEMKRTPIIEWQAAVSNNKGDNKKAFIGYYHHLLSPFIHS